MSLTVSVTQNDVERRMVNVKSMIACGVWLNGIMGIENYLS